MAAEAEDLADLHVDLVAMRRRHLRGVLRIENQVYPRPWSLGLFLSELALRTTRVYFVAKVGTTVVGYAGLMLTGSDGHITTIAVDPAWHRRGIGTRLLLAVSRAGIAMGCTGLTLEVRMSNDAAQGMYRRFGYAPAGVRKNYYAESNEDALIMWAHDVDRVRGARHHHRGGVPVMSERSERIMSIEAVLGAGAAEGGER